MIKIKNTRHSNLYFGTVMFLGFLLLWGCSKNVAPPEVEEPPAPVVEAIPEPESEAEIDLTQEEVDRIQESDETGFGGAFETSGPEAIDEIVVVEVVPGSESEPGLGPIPACSPESEEMMFLWHLRPSRYRKRAYFRTLKMSSSCKMSISSMIAIGWTAQPRPSFEPMWNG